MRLLPALAAGLATLALAGCGSQVAGSTSETAALAPADAGAWISLNLDRDSEQWRRTEALLARIPGAEKALDRLLAEATGKSGISLRELEQALGPELVLVLAAGSEEPVALTRPEDGEALRRLVERSDDRAVIADVEGWTAIAPSEATLEAYRGALARGSLADSPELARVLEGLPEDVLATAYLDGSGLQGAAGRAGGALGGMLPGLPTAGPAGALGKLGLAVAAEADGFRLEGSSTGSAGAPPAVFEPKLLARVPAGALVAATFRGGDAVRDQLRRLGGGQELEQLLRTFLGVSPDELAALAGGEAVLSVRARSPVPEVTLALESAGGDALRVVDRIVRRLAAGATFGSADEGGVRVTRVEIQPGITLSYGQADDVLLVSLGSGGVRAFVGDGPKLVDSAAFQEAMRAAGYEGETAGLAYVDVDGLVPLVEGLAGTAGGAVDGDALEALEAFDSLALTSSVEDGTTRFTGVLRLR